MIFFNYSEPNIQFVHRIVDSTGLPEILKKTGILQFRLNNPEKTWILNNFEQKSLKNPKL